MTQFVDLIAAQNHVGKDDRQKQNTLHATKKNYLANVGVFFFFLQKQK